MLQVSAAWHEIGIVFLEIILVLDWILYAVFFTLAKLCQKVLVFTSHSPVHTSIFSGAMVPRQHKRVFHFQRR